MIIKHSDICCIFFKVVSLFIH